MPTMPIPANWLGALRPYQDQVNSEMTPGLMIAGRQEVQPLGSPALMMLT